MKAKLIKTDVNYLLEDDKGVVIASTSLNTEGRMLSLKNCQSIELGYDLDELLDNISPKNGTTGNISERIGFVKGFKKCLELMGDKKYSEFDITKAFEYGWNQRHFDKTDEDELREIQKRFIQSLQQTEWDVEVVMEYVGECNGNNDEGCFQDSPGHNCGCYKIQTKFDEEGCIILKRV